MSAQNLEITAMGNHCTEKEKWSQPIPVLNNRYLPNYLRAVSLCSCTLLAENLFERSVQQRHHQHDFVVKFLKANQTVSKSIIHQTTKYPSVKHTERCVSARCLSE